ncbi:TetR/AcrR family transcriptional regulator [Nordella sp. HKS 07]|uniref:TetR/AcrR family transcriptional regulator n=1 Tax=Nordella sp. HKS 07 TaxID=2712222 RepID=UPI0013E102D4|nr:TetR/AcrR family transcriptional regulator [Nordella sp. HKS 07]QIG48501.1 TetR/AcrR family transcriptional regulator [Nordella sp. HKS 07]
MGKGKTKRNTRDLILDAAELIVDRDGVNSLTFDALAAEARVSKGTTLYHFDCKEALTSAMIERFVARFDTAWADAIHEDKEALGRKIRAYVKATIQGEAITGKTFDKVNGAITAALTNFPDRVEPVRQQGQRHQAAIEADGLDPVFATIIRMANDGLWFAESFNLMHYDPKLKQAVAERLVAWTKLQKLPTAETLGAGEAKDEKLVARE